MNPYTILNESNLKNQKIIYGQGKTKKVSRYLSNVPCKVSCEFKCNELCKAFKISNNISTFVVLDTEYLLHYSELLESIDNIGFIITLSSLIYIQNADRRLYLKLKKLFEDPAKFIILFQNEYHSDCFISQTEEEEVLDFVTRQNFVTAQFYLSHLNFVPNVVLLTNNTSVALVQYQNLMRKLGIDSTKNVEILNMKEYLNQYHVDNVSARELINSLDAAIQAIQSNDKESLQYDLTQDAVDYLPDEVLVASLKSGDFMKGIIRVNKFRSREEAYVVITEGNSSKQLAGVRGEVLISGQGNRNRAIDGDSVIIKVFPESQWVIKKFEIAGSEANAEPSVPIREEFEVLNTELNLTNKTPTAKVVGINNRNWRDYVCSFEKNDMNTGRYVLVTPFDRRIPRIRIGISDIDKLIDQRFIVRIDGWSVGSKYPNGHFVDIIGPIGDIETETKTLLIEYKLYNRPFTTAQLAELPINSKEQPWRMDETEVAKRRDLRDLLIFSIDPIGCQDVDDAMSIRKLPNGNIELGVHIADVTYFVAPHSLLDLEARKRSTSIYMADRRFDMLPHVLSGDLCSLWSDVDRYAVSVIWEMTPEIEVLKVEYVRSVIKSRYKLHYELAQDIYDDKVQLVEALQSIPELKRKHDEAGNGSALFSELCDALQILIGLSNVLRDRRLASGGLELESTEVQAVFSDSERTQLEDLRQKEPLPVHETVAECMIWANHWVARRCLQAYPSRSCLRRHPPPRFDHFSELLQCAATRDFTIDVSSNLSLARSLDRAVDPSDPQFNRLLRTLATLAMSNAEYISSGTVVKYEEQYHYGLALPSYTHFTSPIRRYSDILVHRLLLCAVDNVPEDSLLTNSALTQQCDIMNSQHRQAQFVQRASIELFQALFFKSKPENDSARYCEGVIVQLKSNGLVVQVPRYGIKGTVYLKKQDGTVAWQQQQQSTATVDWLSSPSQVNLETVTKDNYVNKLIVKKTVGNGCQVYRLFDRVAVKITVSESRTAGLSLQMELVGGKPLIVVEVEKRDGEETKCVSKADMFESVRREAEKRKYVQCDEVDPLEAIASLHSKTSLCHLFREFKQRKLS